MEPSSNGFYKHLFLIDALGAIVSALFLGVVWVRFNQLVGMPIHILKILALIPCFFIVYSFCCYFFLNRNWRPFLKAIAIANSIYCLTTICLVIYHHQDLTLLGISYFFLEIIVIGVLVSMELGTVSRKA